MTNFLKKKMKKFNNSVNSIKVYCKMNTVSMNSGNKIFEPHRLLFNLSEKINLKRSNCYVSKIKNTLFEVKR